MKEKKGVPVSLDFPEGSKIIYLKRDENVIAVCCHPRCKSLIYIGADTSLVQKTILRERLVDHIDFFEEPHEVDLIYPRRRKDRIIDAEVYLTTGTRLTVESEIRHTSNQRRRI